MAVRNAKKLIYVVAIFAVIIILLVVIIYTDDTTSNIPAEHPDYLNHPAYPVQLLDIEDIQDDIVIEEDVAVIVRDGTRLSANVYRPTAPGTYPVIMTFTAYGKDRGPDQYPRYLRSIPMMSEYDMGTIEVSPWTTWEGPDPAFWVPHDYVVVYVDTRGYFGSEGDASLLSAQDGEDFYDAIEWAAAMDWSNAMSVYRRFLFSHISMGRGQYQSP